MTASWRPSADREALELRAELLHRTRRFFRERGVLEVETPVLGAAAVTDRHLHSLATEVDAGGVRRRLFLQTSPELYMKRLLAAGVGSIFQIAKAFRDQERGRLHNPEFTLLEWYRIGFDHHRLMDEMDELLAALIEALPAERVTYRQSLMRSCGLDPDTASLAEIVAAAGSAPPGLDDRDDALGLLFSLQVEPTLGRGRPTFVYDYPPTQAALARIQGEGAGAVAERFEVYLEGVELANGFHELADPAEQRRRFEADLEARRRARLPLPAIDEAFLAALEHGLPDCAGVALGLDRLLLAAIGRDSLEEVLAFPSDRL